MPGRRSRLKSAVWLAAFIAIGSIVALCLLVALGMYAWAHIVPPLEAEPTPAGLRVTVHRAMLRDVEISVNGGPALELTELPAGVTVLPWIDFGLAPSPTLCQEITQVQATGTSRFSKFQTTLGFNKLSASSEATSQYWEYVSTANE